MDDNVILTNGLGVSLSKPATPSMQTLPPEALRANVFLNLLETRVTVEPLSKNSLAVTVIPLVPVSKTLAVITKPSFAAAAAETMPNAGLETLAWS